MDEMLRINNLNVIDVREHDEHEMGHIQGALLMPLNSLPTQLENLDKSKTYHIVCHSGSRSQIAAQYLSSKGYSVVNVLGGMSAYKGKLSYEM